METYFILHAVVIVFLLEKYIDSDNQWSLSFYLFSFFEADYLATLVTAFFSVCVVEVGELLQEEPPY